MSTDTSREAAIDTILDDFYYKSLDETITSGDNIQTTAEARQALIRLMDLERNVAEVKSLLHFRDLYDRLEIDDTRDFEGNKIATWSGYKHIRNPISDRIEEITGFRDSGSVKKWLAELTKSQDGKP